MTGGRISHITSNADLQTHTAKAGKSGLVVIDFHATWCGPCHAIAPFYEEMAKKYQQVTFLKCDVDAAQEVSQTYSVRAMPTFVFLKGSSKVETVQGANRNGIETAIKKHAGATGSTAGHSWGTGSTLANGTTSKPLPRPEQLVERAKGLNPQLQLLLVLVFVYCFYWYKMG